jgi:hypothetical protein
MSLITGVDVISTGFCVVANLPLIVVSPAPASDAASAKEVPAAKVTLCHVPAAEELSTKYTYLEIPTGTVNDAPPMKSVTVKAKPPRLRKRMSEPSVPWSASGNATVRPPTEATQSIILAATTSVLLTVDGQLSVWFVLNGSARYETSVGVTTVPVNGETYTGVVIY